MASSLPKYYEKTLDNGLKIVAIPLKNGTNVISTDIFYDVGSRDEVMGKSGIAHMLEHLNFKSTKNLKAGEFDTIVKGFGGVNNASTGFDFTHYYIKSSTKNMSKSLELYADLMENLTLKDEEFQPERDVVAEERRWRTDNSPMGYLYFKLFNNVFTYHPYHWTPIGFMDDIQNWSINDIKDFHSTYYQPKNAIILVTGDIDKDTVFNEATKYFKDIKNTKEIPEKIHTVEPKQDGEKRVVIHKDSQVEMLAITYHIPDFNHKDQVALSALSELLSSGKSSRLNELLIDKKQLSNSVYAYNMELKDPGVYLFMAMCNPGVEATDVEKEILSVIEDIKNGKIKQKELDKIKINTKADFIFSLESSTSVANLYGSYLIRGNMKPLLNYENDINKLKLQDIIDVAKKYLNTNNSTTVILKK
ncbi:MAG: insulinase family protein [Campylobacteraceae bacterium]|nr:insulinase family protein [Campylobacteraceae bacterium]MBT3882877.1 insulinase family protein [Campylobacteraceae bacterium]MBT4030809.1 insulinase family protein [Campylobacteraceae bacterium]MBT4179101.1 insulinase family protein [Campylobacteraceae bacterium]MBT4572935.1 insulinase family protein [Campylobacteraceae bacterium]